MDSTLSIVEDRLISQREDRLVPDPGEDDLPAVGMRSEKGGGLLALAGSANQPVM